MAYAVTCPCGANIRGETEDEIVTKVQQHGKEVHSQEITREEALAMAKKE